MHIVLKFQFFILIFTVVKLKNENQNFKRGEGNKERVFCNFFNVAYLDQLMRYKFQIYFKIMLIILSTMCVKILPLYKLLMCQNIKRVRSTCLELEKIQNLGLLKNSITEDSQFIYTIYLILLDYFTLLNKLIYKSIYTPIDTE